jgi:hypothetical protein
VYYGVGPGHYRLPVVSQLAESTIDDLGLVDDNATNIVTTIAATRAEILNLWNPYSRALTRMVNLLINASLFKAGFISMLQVWKKEPAELKDMSETTQKLFSQTANRISVWLKLSTEVSAFDPVKNPEDLAPLQEYLKNGKILVDYMRMEEAKKVLTVTDALVVAMGGPVAVLLKRVIQIAYAKLVRPVRQAKVVVGAGAAVAGKAAYQAGEYVVKTTATTVGGALKLITFISKYGVYIAAAGAALYFLAPMVASTAGRTLGGYAGGKRKGEALS